MRARWGQFVTEERPLTDEMKKMLTRLADGQVTSVGMEYVSLRGLEMRGLARCVGGMKTYEITEAGRDHQR
jgi:hypothetical protein